MKQLFILAIALMMTVAAQAKGEKTNGQWVATWATATEFTGKGDMPKSGTLTEKAIRQIVHVSIGGQTMRLHLSNASSSPCCQEYHV